MTTFTGSHNFHPIEFPKQWFATPCKERELIFEELVKRELELADRVLNPVPPTEGRANGNYEQMSSSGGAKPPNHSVPGKFVHRRPPAHATTRTPPSANSSSSSSSADVPRQLESWQERNKKINQRVDCELEKTDRILENAQRFKADLLQWMERLKDPPTEPDFSPRPSEVSSKPSKTNPRVYFKSPEPTLSKSSSDVTAHTQEQVAKQEERLRTVRQKYEGQQAAKRIVKSLQDHLRDYLKMDPVVARGSQVSTDSGADSQQPQRNQARRSAAVRRKMPPTCSPERAKTMWARTRPEPSTDWRKSPRKPASSQSANRCVRLSVPRTLLARRLAGSLPPISQRLAPHGVTSPNVTPRSPCSFNRLCSIGSLVSSKSGPPICVQSLSLCPRPPASPTPATGAPESCRKRIAKKCEPAGAPEASKTKNAKGKSVSPGPVKTLGTIRSLEALAQRQQEREQARSGAGGTRLERIRNRRQGSCSD